MGTNVGGLGFGVWGWGFGVWGLGSGVWGLGSPPLARSPEALRWDLSPVDLMTPREIITLCRVQGLNARTTA